MSNQDEFEQLSVPYGLSIRKLIAASGFRWNRDVNENRFKRRPFEQNNGKILTKLYAPMRKIWSLELAIELEDKLHSSGATLHEGVAWAQKHNVRNYSPFTIIRLFGSTYLDSNGKVWVPCLFVSDDHHRWCVDCDWEVDLTDAEGDANIQYLAVRRGLNFWR